MSKPEQKIRLRSFVNDYRGLLSILDPPLPPPSEILADKKPFRQLQYIITYLSDAQLRAKSILHERHYVDRDYMEDYGVFYSRTLRPTLNSCQRLHFFSEQKLDVERLIAAALRTGVDVDNDAIQKLNHAYLGFVIIRPLSGAPVGRTVLKLLPSKKNDGHMRSFGGARVYETHVLGLTLRIRGLAFQQQDEGVSACATTALWCSLQKVREFEDIRCATPAEITMLASRHSLPFGRAMPSEGLNIDQMCQAIHAVGLAPNLYRLVSRSIALGLIQAAEQSGFPGVLIMKDPDKNSGRYHAVTIVGTKSKPGAKTNNSGLAVDSSHEISGLYVNDDRLGPYVLTTCNRTRTNGFRLSITFPLGNNPELWDGTHLLIPVHPKIRLSFLSLRRIAIKIAGQVHKLINNSHNGSPITCLYECRVLRGHKYVEQLCNKSSSIQTRKVGLALASLFPLPRYLGVIAVRAIGYGDIDLLLDTTGTIRSPACVAIVHREAGARPLPPSSLLYLANLYNCKAIE